MSEEPERRGIGARSDALRGARIAVLGARGAVGRVVTRALLTRGALPRLVSRRVDRLADEFRDGSVELFPADLRDLDPTETSVAAADGIVLSVGVPVRTFEDHLIVARNLAGILLRSSIPTVVVSSYWTYGVLPDRPVSEDREPRRLPDAAAVRREAENVLLEAGAAVAVLPDFYGPGARTSFLNEAVVAAASGRRAFWPGDPEAPRSFLHVPDVGPVLCELLAEPGAAGSRWNVAGSDPVAPAEVIRRAAFPEPARIVRGRRWMVALASLFRPESRGFTGVMPIYESPAILDGSRLAELIGGIEFTGYDEWLKTASQTG